MGQELSGKVAIVTGGASGIGRATAELFVEEGAQVVVADVDAEQGEELSASLGGAAAFQPTDVSDADDVQALVDFTVGHFGGLDVMFNNAGIPSSFRRILDNDLRDFDRVMGVNLFGVMVGTQLAARHMAEHGGGSIINTSSIAALSGGAGPIIYRVSKAAVVQYSRSAARSTSPTTGSGSTASRPVTSPPRSRNYDMGPVIQLTQPLQRHGDPIDVANAVLYLASDRAGAGHRHRAPRRWWDDGRAAGEPAPRPHEA